MSNNKPVIKQSEFLYYCLSIVNGKKVYRVWRNGDLVGQFSSESEAVDLLLKLKGYPKNINTMIDHRVIYVLKNMFLHIGLTEEEFMNFNFMDIYWYEKHTWSKKKENQFIKWLSDELMQSKELRKFLSNTATKRKDTCDNLARMFVFTYGWKIESELNDD